MAIDYTQEQLWKIYENLPEELKTAIFSEETADTIDSVCKKNNLPDEKISEVAKNVGYVLLGILPPSEFQNTLEKEVKLKKETAKRISQAITRLVFWSRKESLDILYKTEFVSPEKRVEQKKPEIKKEDIYREPIE